MALREESVSQHVHFDMRSTSGYIGNKSVTCLDYGTYAKK